MSSFISGSTWLPFGWLLANPQTHAMGLFDFLKDKGTSSAVPTPFYKPYREDALNNLYNLLFADDVDLYRRHTQPDAPYPMDVLLRVNDDPNAWHAIAADRSADPRARLLACTRLRAAGQVPPVTGLLAIIVEVGLDMGLDALASFSNGSARYFNQSGRLLIWETSENPETGELTRRLFHQAEAILPHIGIWDQPRLPPPTNGTTRLTLVGPQGMYFGQGPTDAFFGDPLAKPALETATRLMEFLTRADLNR